MLIKIPRGWEIPERTATSEDVSLNRRSFLQALGIAGISTLAGCASSGAKEAPEIRGRPEPSATAALYPARRNERFTLDRPLTAEVDAANYNNFYEFSSRKELVARLVEPWQTRPWQVEVGGLVHKPQTFDIDTLVRKMPLEERLYRHRCVEAWSMSVPWTGFPIKALVDLVQPLASAKYLRMVTFHDPQAAPGLRNDTYPWPYHEGLSLAEATNELSLFVTGIYGHELTKQHGAPIRLVVPWKYGYKSIKSIVRLEFVEEQPRTFWNTLIPWEYDFVANVNPAIPHPRWSQASERILGTREIKATLPYNGYGEFVASLYQT